MDEEWVKDARSEAKLADNLRAETSKSLATTEKKKKELTLKLVVENKERKNAEAASRMLKRKPGSSVKSSTTQRYS